MQRPQFKQQPSTQTENTSQNKAIKQKQANTPYKYTNIHIQTNNKSLINPNNNTINNSNPINGNKLIRTINQAKTKHKTKHQAANNKQQNPHQSMQPNQTS